MNVPKRIQESFYNNILGEVFFGETPKIENREHYLEFIWHVTHEKAEVQDKYWYDMIIDYTTEAVENRYYLRQEELDLAVRIFNRKPLEERVEIGNKYDYHLNELPNPIKSTEVIKEWFDEMFNRTLQYVQNNRGKLMETRHIFEHGEKEKDLSVMMIFEVRHKKTNETCYFNIKHKEESEHVGMVITSIFCYTTSGYDLEHTPVGDIFFENNEYVITKVK